MINKKDYLQHCQDYLTGILCHVERFVWFCNPVVKKRMLFKIVNALRLHQLTILFVGSLTLLNFDA